MLLYFVSFAMIIIPVPASKIAKMLLTELDKLKFGHEPGTVWHSSYFRYVKQCGLFVEQYNVTKVKNKTTFSLCIDLF